MMGVTMFDTKKIKHLKKTIQKKTATSIPSVVCPECIKYPYDLACNGKHKNDKTIQKKEGITISASPTQKKAWALSQKEPETNVYVCKRKDCKYRGSFHKTGFHAKPLSQKEPEANMANRMGGELKGKKIKVSWERVEQKEPEEWMEYLITDFLTNGNYINGITAVEIARELTALITPKILILLSQQRTQTIEEIKKEIKKIEAKYLSEVSPFDGAIFKKTVAKDIFDSRK